MKNLFNERYIPLYYVLSFVFALIGTILFRISSSMMSSLYNGSWFFVLFCWLFMASAVWVLFCCFVSFYQLQFKQERTVSGWMTAFLYLVSAAFAVKDGFLCYLLQKTARGDWTFSSNQYDALKGASSLGRGLYIVLLAQGVIMLLMLVKGKKGINSYEKQLSSD